MRHIVVVVRFFCILIALPLSSQEPAQEAPEAPPTFTDVVVVSASRSEEEMINAPAAMTVIDAKTLESSASTDYGDLLRSVPGLNVIQVSARDLNVTSRAATGVVANTQLVLLDGRPINSTFFGNVPWEFIPVNRPEIARIEVIRGPASAVWGAGAMNGVINVVTKLPREMQGTIVNLGIGGFERPRGSESGGGSLFYADASHAGTVSDRLAYQVSGGLYSHDAFARPMGLIPNRFQTPYPPYENQDTLQPRINLRFDVSPPARDQVVLLAAGYAGTEGIQLTPGGPFLQESDNSLSYFQADYSRGNFHSRFYTNRYDAVSTSLLSRGPDGQPIQSNFETRSYKVELSRQSAIGERHLLTYGGNLSYDAFDLALAPEGKNRNDQGAYLEDEVRFSDRLRWVLGVRADRFSEVDDPVLSPRSALLIKPSASQTLRLSYNRAYRAPSLFENYIDFDIVSAIELGRFDPRRAGAVFPFSTNVRGTRDLEEVSQTSYEIGYLGSVGSKVMLSAALYYNEVENEIQNVATPYSSDNPPPGWLLPPELLDVLIRSGAGLPAVLQLQNVGNIRNRGLELGLDVRPQTALRLFANYSWQDRPDSDDIDPLSLNLPPKKRANAGAEIHLKRLEGNLVVSYSDDAFWADVLDARFHGATEAFTMVNAGIGWWWRGGRVLTSLKVTNLLNERIQQHVFGDLVSRRAVAELRWSL